MSKSTTVNTAESTIKRTVGIEIECMTPHRPPVDELRDECEINVGSDGSIDGDGEGIEIRTSPLAGTVAEENIKSIATILAEHEAFTNQSCGLHVHVDAREVNVSAAVRWTGESGSRLENETLVYVNKNSFRRSFSSDMEVFCGTIDLMESKGLAAVYGQYGEGMSIDTPEVRSYESSERSRYLIPDSLYQSYYALYVDTSKTRFMKHRLFEATRFFAAVDPILRGLVPSSRRHNTYCKPLEKVTRLGGPCPETLREVVKSIGERYCGINLRALEAHGTIECRYHGGTVNADKIIHWARLWERVVDTALSDVASYEADALAEVVNGKNRLEMLLALLGLPEDTCTYFMSRHSAFMGSDARHTIKYVKDHKKAHAQAAEREARNVAIRSVRTVDLGDEVHRYVSGPIIMDDNSSI